MSSPATEQQTNHSEEQTSTVNMESVQRIAHLPVVESTIQTAANIYGKVKDYNSVTNWTLQTAENTLHKAIEVGKPVATPVYSKLEGPIKKVDDILCTGLDYVESKIPAVKLPPTEILLQIYESTKEYVSSTVTPVVEGACTYVKPVVETAKHVVEPAVQTAKQVVEPYVQPTIQKVEKMFHSKNEEQESEVEVEEKEEAKE